MASEAAIQKRSITHAKARGVDSVRLCFRPGVARGWPDVLFLIPGGRPLFIEFKAPGNRATVLQQHVMRRLEAAGYDVSVCDSFDAAREAIARALVRASIPAPRV